MLMMKRIGQLIKRCRYGVAMLPLFVSSWAFAVTSDSKGVGGVAANVVSTFANLAKLITAGSFVAGMGFAIGAILKFKAHKDNPQQIPVGTPIALVFIAAALIFLPQIFTTAGHTLFQSGGQAGNISGVVSFSD